MKNFFKHFLKLGGLVLVVVLLMAGAVSYSLKNKNAEKVYAGVGENITGFAWSENIGLVSFNSTNCDTDNDGGSNGGTGCPASGTAMASYGVNIADDGKLSGYAWSENIGWITFNRDNANTPPQNDPGAGLLAYIDTNGTTVKGWARAMSACDDANSDGKCDASGAGTNSGGWDGWIALGDMSVSAPNYGTTLDVAVRQFKGFAWGGNDAAGVIGWLSFNSTNCDSDNNGTTDTVNYSSCPSGQISKSYAVSTTFELNQAPNAPISPDLAIEPNANSYCGSGSISFKWKFTDPNVNSPQNQQSKYKIEASYNTGGPFSIVREEDLIKNNNESVSILVPLSEIKLDLGSDWYNKTLYWKVTVWDNAATPKQATSTEVNYKLPNNEYKINFTSNPILSEIHADQDVEFSDTSKVYNSISPGGVDLNMDNVSSVCGVNCSRLWNFSANAVPTTSTLANPIVKFSKSISTTISLTYTDTDKYSNTYTCSFSQDIGVKLPIPKFEEKK